MSDHSDNFPQIRDPEHDFRLPTPEELVRIRADFVESGGRADGDTAIWSPSTEPSATRVGDYGAAGVTWWFSDGSTITPEQLRKRIDAGPRCGHWMVERCSTTFAFDSNTPVRLQRDPLGDIGSNHRRHGRCELLQIRAQMVRP